MRAMVDPVREAVSTELIVLSDGGWTLREGVCHPPAKKRGDRAGQKPVVSLRAHPGGPVSHSRNIPAPEASRPRARPRYLEGERWLRNREVTSPDVCTGVKKLLSHRKVMGLRGTSRGGFEAAFG